MTSKKRPQKLSLGEFRMMGLLWHHGPMTLADAFRLQSGQLAYTTIQTKLNRLVVKRLVARTRKRPMKYRALIAPQNAGESVLQTLIDSVGSGSVLPLVVQLIGRGNLTAAEAGALKRAIDRAVPKRRTKRRLSTTRQARDGSSARGRAMSRD